MRRGSSMLILFFLAKSCLFAQEVKHCFSNKKAELLYGDSYLKQVRSNTEWKKNETAFLDNEQQVLIVPVVVHVIYETAAQNISDELIQKQIGILNLDYRRRNLDASETPDAFKSISADCSIEFSLAKQDPFGNPTNGITRTQTTVSEIGNTDSFFLSAKGGADIWDRNSYLNIWVCAIDVNGSVLGFSPLPSFNPLRDRDGVVIDYRYFGTSANSHYNKGRTCTHEIGHWFDLQHVWGDDGGMCFGSDDVEDTPNQSAEHYGKPSFPSLDSCSSAFPGTVFMNYLDYTDDASMNMFTKGQKQRMWNSINSTFRDSLKISKGCYPVGSDAEELFIYPNPSSDYFQLHFFLSEPSEIKITVVNLLGKIVSQSNLPAQRVGSEIIDLSNLAKGIYCVQLETNSITKVKKLIRN